MEELLQRIAVALERIANVLENQSTGVISDPWNSEDDPTDDWTSKYNDPIFAPTTETTWVSVIREHRTRVFSGKYNDAGNPIIRLVSGTGIKLEVGQKILVYARPFLADGGNYWELCDPSGNFSKREDAEKA